MARACEYNYGGECDRVATTTLTRNNGQVQQLCERHRNILITLFKGIASGDIHVEQDTAVTEANHWLVKNKILS
jgi:hypothetical protein